MQTLKLGTAAAVLAATMMVGSTMGASAQPMMMKKTHGRAARAQRPLTVAAPVPAPAPNPLVAPIGFASGLVVAPLSGLSQAFGYGPVGLAPKPLPIVAKYAGVGPVTTTVPQGWAQDVPISANGPIYKLEPVANAGQVSPFALIAAPITAAFTLASVPGSIAGAAVGATPAPAPVF